MTFQYTTRASELLLPVRVNPGDIHPSYAYLNQAQIEAIVPQGGEFITESLVIFKSSASTVLPINPSTIVAELNQGVDRYNKTR